MPDEREEFSLEEFAQSLDLERITLGGPIFDLEKLSWLNGKYIRGLTIPQFLERLRAGLLSDEYLLQILPLVQERIEKLEDFLDYSSFFFVGEVSYDTDAVKRLIPKGRAPKEVAKMLKALVEEHLDPLLDWRATLEHIHRAFGDANGWTPKEMFMTLRIAVTGRAASPPFETMAVLGKEVCGRGFAAPSRP